MLEALVAGLCIGDYSCDKALKAYYYQEPRLKAVGKELKNRAIVHLGESVVYTMPALMLAASGHSYQLKLGQKWSVGKSHNDSMVFYRFDF